MIVPLFAGPVSISGHALAGDHVVRFIYIDEAGRSSTEPVCVTVASIIGADRQWLELQRYHSAIVSKFIPDSDREDFVFHATDLFSGGPYFKREIWSLEIRMEILRKLLAARKLFDLPLSVGYSYKNEERRAVLPPRYQAEKEYAQYRHVEAFASCLGGCERYMRDIAGEGELGMIISEDVPDARKELKLIFKRMKKRGEFSPDIINGAFPFRHIVDTPLFAEKGEAPLLQFVDAFAFAVRRWLGKFSHGKALMKAMGLAFKYDDITASSGVRVYAGREDTTREGASRSWRRL